jgi:hypothetical protein
VISLVLNLFGGIYEMLRAGWIARFRLNGRYWGWRTQTAFPVGQAPKSLLAKVVLAVEYFMWVRRIRTQR